MYDLTVEEVHTYYVVAGSVPVLVHNCGNGKTPPNPDGKLGGPPHRQKVAEVAQGLRDQGYTVKTEVRFDTPTGFKPYRFADVVAYDGAGAMVSIHQIG